MSIISCELVALGGYLLLIIFQAQPNDSIILILCWSYQWFRVSEEVFDCAKCKFKIYINSSILYWILDVSVRC